MKTIVVWDRGHGIGQEKEAWEKSWILFANWGLSRQRRNHWDGLSRGSGPRTSQGISRLISSVLSCRPRGQTNSWSLCHVTWRQPPLCLHLMPPRRSFSCSLIFLQETCLNLGHYDKLCFLPTSFWTMNSINQESVKLLLPALGKSAVTLPCHASQSRPVGRATGGTFRNPHRGWSGAEAPSQSWPQKRDSQIPTTPKIWGDLRRSFGLATICW